MKRHLTEANVMSVILENPGITQPQLARHFNVHHATVHTLVDWMFAQHKVDRAVITGILSIPKT